MDDYNLVQKKFRLEYLSVLFFGFLFISGMSLPWNKLYLQIACHRCLDYQT